MCPLFGNQVYIIGMHTVTMSCHVVGFVSMGLCYFVAAATMFIVYIIIMDALEGRQYNSHCFTINYYYCIN